MATDLARMLGWDSYRAESEWLYRLPETTLAELARTVRRRLPAPTLRVVGDSALRVTTIGLSPGAAGFARHRQLLQQDNAEVLVIGEAHEGETGGNGADAVAAGGKQAVVKLGNSRFEPDVMWGIGCWP